MGINEIGVAMKNTEFQELEGAVQDWMPRQRGRLADCLRRIEHVEAVNGQSSISFLIPSFWNCFLRTARASIWICRIRSRVSSMLFAISSSVMVSSP